VSYAFTSFAPSRYGSPANALAPQHVLGEFPTYAGAEQVVARLSDNGFPVEHVRIVGIGLRSVEYVSGRLTTGRAALAGVAGGAWFGVLIGVLLGLFTTGSAWFGLLLASTAFGAVWGGTLGFLAQWATRGRRDFASVKGLEAAQYAVSVDASHADDATRASGLGAPMSVTSRHDQHLAPAVGADGPAGLGGGGPVGAIVDAPRIARRARLIAGVLAALAVALLLVALLAASGTAAWLEAAGAIALLIGGYSLRFWSRRELLYRPLRKR